MSGARLALFPEAGASIEDALRPGPFAEIAILSPTAGPLGAVEAAEAAGCDWLMRIGPGETLRAEAPDLAGAAISAYDAVFGAVALSGETGPWKPSRLAFDEASRLPHALLNWWIGTRPLIRTATERRVLEALPDGASGAAYVFEVWQAGRAIKLAAALTECADAPAPLSDAERSSVLARLAEEPLFLDIPYGDGLYRLPYTGRNAGIEREQTRGLFFEAHELEALKRRMGPGAVVADVGANTGNHTIFFAGPMRASRVIPFEPLPELGAVIRRTVAENGLANVETRNLGLGLSDRPGRMGLRLSERGGFGATRLVEDADGSVEVVRLDDVLTGPVDLLKIDVESMEMQVLAGAEALISSVRPVIFIEIAHDNTEAFMGWLAQRAYRVERIFPDKGHANYLIAPHGP
ncbi:MULTISPECIES: FkbM family methyltransferase [unclassified Aureimonas]|uniref:FkbM family methyltransferase n=1 Tax=unclassified Aureimonas TaxID=2615206 RepID=UPI0006F20BC7|nr:MULTISPECIES: FkbM family methyltransferase [unclassified Aureimonas]KQT64249.1 hypothetical protein ASG62_04455 [Aureimonas sp. Leaf427]KQT81438.1 hypothetical protein ASG54_01720 [Aureimonas sp. Leaf460]